MNSYADMLLDQVRGTWRYRWLALSVACIGAAAGWLVVFMLPDRYEASAAVLVDTRTALKPALEGLAVQQDVGVQLSYVRESLLADPELLRIATEGGVLSAAGVDPEHQDQVLRQMRDRIQLTMQSADDRPVGAAGGVTYRIVYQDTDRSRDLRIVQILLRTLIDKTQGGERQGAQNAQQFLLTQVQDYERRLRASEDRLADFKSHHLAVMPTEQGGSFAQLQAEVQAIGDVKTKLIVAENRRRALDAQLHGDAAALAATAVTVPGSPGAAIDTASRIVQTQAHLDELLLKYTDRHPDVIAARAALDELKKRRAAEIQSLRQGDANAIASSGASSNPVYQSIQLALNQTDVDIAALRAQLAQHEAKASELRKLLDTAPQVEAEYQQLSRDYDVNKAQYNALLANYEKARLGEQADNAGSVSFKVIQPPLASIVPVWPRRDLLLVAALLLSMAAGVGLAYLLDQQRPVVGSAKGLAQLTEVRILATVGSAFPQRARLALRREVQQVAFVAVCLVVAFVVVWALSDYGVRVRLSALQHLVHT